MGHPPYGKGQKELERWATFSKVLLHAVSRLRKISQDGHKEPEYLA